ncbi:putative signal peptide protein [Puccinia sorghi]|uniref:Putative signal peptide protein n=1 Tax=Puccinia sorghi TaxID=27349 RepID=A0A0L6U5L2_9BASI|nr:putative signal peptide protein [Puccinia sorghi]
MHSDCASTCQNNQPSIPLTSLINLLLTVPVFHIHFISAVPAHHNCHLSVPVNYHLSSLIACSSYNSLLNSKKIINSESNETFATVSCNPWSNLCPHQDCPPLLHLKNLGATTEASRELLHVNCRQLSMFFFFFFEMTTGYSKILLIKHKCSKVICPTSTACTQVGFPAIASKSLIHSLTLVEKPNFIYFLNNSQYISFNDELLQGGGIFQSLGVFYLFLFFIFCGLMREEESGGYSVRNEWIEVVKKGVWISAAEDDLIVAPHQASVTKNYELATLHLSAVKHSNHQSLTIDLQCHTSHSSELLYIVDVARVYLLLFFQQIAHQLSLASHCSCLRSLLSPFLLSSLSLVFYSHKIIIRFYMNTFASKLLFICDIPSVMTADDIAFRVSISASISAFQAQIAEETGSIPVLGKTTFSGFSILLHLLPRFMISPVARNNRKKASREGERDKII